jgi:hypothetical protein
VSETQERIALEMNLLNKMLEFRIYCARSKMIARAGPCKRKDRTRIPRRALAGLINFLQIQEPTLRIRCQNERQNTSDEKFALLY